MSPGRQHHNHHHHYHKKHYRHPNSYQRYTDDTDEDEYDNNSNYKYVKQHSSSVGSAPDDVIIETSELPNDTQSRSGRIVVAKWRQSVESFKVIRRSKVFYVAVAFLCFILVGLLIFGAVFGTMSSVSGGDEKCIENILSAAEEGVFDKSKLC